MIEMVEGDVRFPEFEKFLEKNDNHIIYPEDIDYLTKRLGSLVLVSFGVTLFAISYPYSSLLNILDCF